MSLPSTLSQLIEQARGYPPLPMAVVDAGETYVLEGAREAAAAGLIEPVLVGERERITALAEQIGYDLTDTDIVEADGEQEAAEKGVQLVLEGRVCGLMKGWIHTDVLMHPVLQHLRTGRWVSHVFAVELPTYPKLLYVTDAAINITPDLPQKAAIVQNAVDLARLLGVERPKVAALSSVEAVKPEIPSTIDAACLSKMAQRHQIRHALVDGPLAFDNAIFREAARIKQIDSEVSGEVDILLVPDLDAQHPRQGPGLSGQGDPGRHRRRCQSAHRAAVAFRPAPGKAGFLRHRGAGASTLAVGMPRLYRLTILIDSTSVQRVDYDDNR